jgi:hypothetical protein
MRQIRKNYWGKNKMNIYLVIFLGGIEIIFVGYCVLKIDSWLKIRSAKRTAHKITEIMIEPEKLIRKSWFGEK